ncbi:flagellar biosynthesis protein FlgD [Mixta theicola]|uniref:Basal-body rod modification protein FlgD n=1 Tax=Mixta theicola TaxID=1458355 RepID=A0A2K1Q858_9GAMM|nr:flagellar hook capping FlgD N-terminal domain-containing protein [Mixta theicola]PNS11213.1 flagellar biosynthesis protein FlgD [Mixta theicola]GLR07520.1 basal-body rod modification protein FlgD [Mixta theicola]
MAVTPVTNSYNATSSSNGSSIEDITNNFMNLLVAQMQNQDPTNPMDNNQLTSLMAQFNTAAGVQQLNSTLGNVGTLVNSMQQMNAAQWVGRSIYVEGDSSVTSTDDTFAFSLNNNVDKVSVVLTDRAGNSYTADLKDVKAGVHKLTLDDLTGFQPAEPGFDNGETYKVTYTAANQDGSVPKIVSLKHAKVESVSFTLSGAVLQLGLGGSATLGEVYLIE